MAVLGQTWAVKQQSLVHINRFEAFRIELCARRVRFHDDLAGALCSLSFVVGVSEDDLACVEDADADKLAEALDTLIPEHFGDAPAAAAVAVTLLTRADAIEVDGLGHPVVVDHKTSESAPRLEKELLAVAMAARHRRDHGRRLRRGASTLPPSRVGRALRGQMYERDDLNDAVKTLRRAAGRFAGFDAYEALQLKPKGVADSECLQCTFRRRCQRWGGPQAAGQD